MPFRPWNPLGDLISLRQGLIEMSGEPGMADGTSWVPLTDVFENKDAYVIKSEIAGLCPDDITVEYREKTLILAGDRPSRHHEQSFKYHQVERSYGRFYKTFVLPDHVCCEEIEAEYKNGVLEIVVPKKPQEGPRSISVQSE